MPSVYASMANVGNGSRVHVVFCRDIAATESIERCGQDSNGYRYIFKESEPEHGQSERFERRNFLLLCQLTNFRAFVFNYMIIKV